METFWRIYIGFDQRILVNLLFITQFVINNNNAVSTGVSFFFSQISREIYKNCQKLYTVGDEIKNPIQKADNIFTKLKQTNDWVQTTMAVV